MNVMMPGRTLLLYSFFLSLLFLFYKGYTFNSWDQAECLPQVYQLLDPSLYSADYFMQEYHKAFTVRFYFVYFIYGLSYLFSVPVVCFTLTVFSLFLSIYYFIKISAHFTENVLAQLFAPVFAFFIFFNFTVGANQVQSNSLIPGTLAAVFAIAGIYFFLEKKHGLSFFILGLGTLFQPLVTLQVFMVLSVLLLFDVKNTGVSTIAKAIPMYLVPASLMLAPIIWRQFFHEQEYDKELYYQLLYRFRNHLHYLPSLFPLSDYLKFSALVIAGFAASRFSSLHNRKFIYRFSAIILAGMFAYWLLLEVADLESIGKLQWFKASVWVNGVASIALAAWIGIMVTAKTQSAQIKAGLVANPGKWLTPVSILCSVLLLFVLLNSAMLPVKKLQERYQAGNYKKADLTLLHEWISENLPKDAVVLCSTENTSFSCEAQRSQPVQYQAIIHEPFYMIPWYEKFKDIYGVSIETAERKDIRKQAAELYRTRNYKGNAYAIRYRIDDISTCKYAAELGPVLHQSGNYVLTQFIAEN